MLMLYSSRRMFILEEGSNVCHVENQNWFDSKQGVAKW
jgi:hypothetical protein